MPSTCGTVASFVYCSMFIKKAEYVLSSPDVGKCPVPDRNEYAFIGRSNVGKSSLINMLCNNDKLAKTSNTPGKTQLINHFAIASTSKPGMFDETNWYLVDLPGYGFAKIALSSRRRWQQMIEHYLKERPNLLQVFVLIDSRHTPQKIDIEFLLQLTKWEVPYTLIFTKSDKEKQAVVSHNIKSFLAEIRKHWQFLPQHFVTSAVKKLGKDKILAFIQEMNDDNTN